MSHFLEKPRQEQDHRVFQGRKSQHILSYIPLDGRDFRSSQDGGTQVRPVAKERASLRE